MKSRSATCLTLAAFGQIMLTVAGCGPAPETPPPASSPPPEAPAFDVFEQALIGRAIKKIERNGQTARLVSHRMSKTASSSTICGVYVIETDPQQTTRYFLSRSDGVWILEGQEDERWQRNC